MVATAVLSRHTVFCGDGAVTDKEAEFLDVVVNKACSDGLYHIAAWNL